MYIYIYIYIHIYLKFCFWKIEYKALFPPTIKFRIYESLKKNPDDFSVNQLETNNTSSGN